MVREYGSYAIDLGLIYFGEKGIFPTDNESLPSFFSRALALTKVLPTQQAPRSFIHYASKKMGGWPVWVDIEKSSEKLAFFERGATFIDEEKVESPAKIHLKRIDETSLLDREVFFHELIHAVRYNFNSDKFEETIAYFFSASPIRKWLGGCFRKTFHTYLFLLFSIMPLMLVVVGAPLIAVYSVSFALLGLFSFVALSHVFAIKRCLKKLTYLFSYKDAPSVLIRLSDTEIDQIGNTEFDQLVPFFVNKIKQWPKWRQIKLQFSSSFLY